MMLRTVEMVIDGAVSAPARKVTLLYRRKKSPLALKRF